MIIIIKDLKQNSCNSKMQLWHQSKTLSKKLPFERRLDANIKKGRNNRLRQQIPDTDTIYSEMEVKLQLPFVSLSLPLSNKNHFPKKSITIIWKEKEKKKQELNIHISRR